MTAGCTENPPAEPARTGLMWFRRDLRAEDGRTGYPLVDAAMAQINQTGYMHNRLRTVTASFLVKDLGIHCWRWGERYFCRKAQ